MKLLFSFLLFPLLAFAELPVTRLNHIFPAGGKAGTSFKIELNGSDWEGEKKVHFSHPGISATGSNEFTITIATNVPPGIYEARISGTYGYSNPRIFSVGTLNEAAETTNTIKSGTVVNGRADQNSVDQFSIAATKGKTIWFRCLSKEIESRLEPVLVLHDPHGREVARSRRADVLEFTPTEDGVLNLKLHDQLYRGGVDYFYRLEIGTLPIIHSAVAGTKLYLEGKNISPAVLDLPATQPFTWAAGPSALAGVAVSPVAQTLVRIPSAPLVIEHETNDTIANAQPIVPPSEIRGTFAKTGDVDFFTFKAAKGEVFWLELVSHRLGEPTDCHLVVKYLGTATNDVLELNDSEANFGGAEFNTSHRDFAGRFEAKETGTYALQVRNLFSVPSGTLPTYYLALRKELPSFSIVVMPNPNLPPKPDYKEIPLTSVVLRRGETLPVKVLAFRRDGFNGDIEIHANNLPTGVVSAGGKIHAGKTSGLLFLQATSEAPSSPIHLEVLGLANKIEVRAQPVILVRTVPNRDEEAAVPRFTSQFVASTMDSPAAVRIQPTTNFYAVASGTELSIPFIITKEAELKAAFKMKPVGLPEVEQGKEVEITPTATNVVFKLNLAKPKLSPGRYYFALQGLAEVKPLKENKVRGLKETSITLYSDPITLEITPEQLQAAAK